MRLMRFNVVCHAVIFIVRHRCAVFLQFADDEALQSEWRAAKKKNKLKVVSLIKERTGYTVNPDAMFDIQVSSRGSCLPLGSQ